MEEATLDCFAGSPCRLTFKGIGQTGVQDKGISSSSGHCTERIEHLLMPGITRSTAHASDKAEQTAPIGAPEWAGREGFAGELCSEFTGSSLDPPLLL